MEELFWEHREKGCGSKRSASSNKEFFLKIATHVFMKKRLIVEEAAWGTPRKRARMKPIHFNR
ncbi:hypothetical protein CK496_03440 [Enterococcus thailandicus]|uniref:Uncharacterized protein n=1 Tax=Enterococcus thailandicus TaxID=417368 RepID=A0A179EQD7_ENTTH|nr:hypothetical protein CK496_03440 [Enterococcus thailandicus]OAQ55447.1 hypothetical protein A6E74_08105 [Enterococcus thailandicus]